MAIEAPGGRHNLLLIKVIILSRLAKRAAWSLFRLHSSIENAILDTFEYAQEFENTLLELSEQSDTEQIEGLEDIFSPLHNTQYQILTLNKSKAKQTWLRLYALRVEDDVYIITGGAIKLTQKMQDRKHTNLELRKIESCRKFLLDQGIVDVEGVIEEIES